MHKDTVILYSIHDCPYCHKMKQDLDMMCIPYQVEMLDEMSMAIKEIPFVPALDINGILYQNTEAIDWVYEQREKRFGLPRPLLTKTFLSYYPDHPAHMSPLGLFTYYRTYSRFLPELGRRETWKETVSRAVEYNVGLERTHRVKIGLPVHYGKLKEEAQNLFDAIFNLKMFVSGRTLWMGGTPVADKFPMANFNCSFTNIDKWEDLSELFYLLMVGSGVGFKCTKEMAANIFPIRCNTNLVISPYNPVPEEQRLEQTEIKLFSNGFAKIYVGDSKEGWRDALAKYLVILTDEFYESIHTVKVSFNSVRPRGERLKTFGGTASGPEPLMEMFEGIDKVLKNQIDPSLAPIETDERGYGHVRPIHILDIGNLIGNNVVSGGVRRTAELFLFDWDDYEVLFAKYGINGFWTPEHFEQHKKVRDQIVKMGIPIPTWFDDFTPENNMARPTIGHRRLSNNSIGFTSEPSSTFLDLIFLMLQLDGEPGFINLEAASNRRDNMQGVNPCGEILLDNKQQCNLTTVNMKAFRNETGKMHEILLGSLLQVQALSVRAGVRMTLMDLELPEWNFKHKRDRLIGCSLTGFEEATADLPKEVIINILTQLRDVADDSSRLYADQLRIPSPLLTTTVKPEGTLSLVAGGVSPGLHNAHSPYFIRRIRISADDALAKAAIDLGWSVHPEIGTPGNDIKNARTLVIDFPVKSSSKVTKDDVGASEQLHRYLMFQREYTAHNSSNTITVRPHEWNPLKEQIKDCWDDFVGVSFLSLDGGTYQLAPYESITQEEYEWRVANMGPFDPAVLAQYEKADDHVVDDVDCATGACPVR